MTIFWKMMIQTKMATSTGRNLEEGKNNKDDSNVRNKARIALELLLLLSTQLSLYLWF